MLAAPFKVVLDANVLYPFTLRDTLLRAAGEASFRSTGRRTSWTKPFAIWSLQQP